jgi:hypothetical protein
MKVLMEFSVTASQLTLAYRKMFWRNKRYSFLSSSAAITVERKNQILHYGVEAVVINMTETTVTCDARRLSDYARAILPNLNFGTWNELTHGKQNTGKRTEHPFCTVYPFISLCWIQINHS